MWIGKFMSGNWFDFGNVKVKGGYVFGEWRWSLIWVFFVIGVCVSKRCWIYVFIFFMLFVKWFVFWFLVYVNID